MRLDAIRKDLSIFSLWLLVGHTWTEWSVAPQYKWDTELLVLVYISVGIIVPTCLPLLNVPCTFLCRVSCGRRGEGWPWGGSCWRSCLQNVWFEKDTLNAKISPIFAAIVMKEKVVIAYFCLSIQKIYSTHYFYLSLHRVG